MSRPRSGRPARLSGGCPCGLAATYDDCCGRLHRGQARAATPEQLMRSRFSAYAVHDEPYLLRTWHPTTRPAAIGLDPAVRWLGLDVLDSTDPGPFGREGIVEFRARYAQGSVPGELHERSRFLRHDNAWTYVDAT
ncbi:MAG: YchJ family protein [Streptosporangiaceae bacterium]